MEAPEEAILRLVDLALRCVAMPVSNRPSMRDVISALEAIKKELYGVEFSKSKSEVDKMLQERTGSVSVSLSEELCNIGWSNESSTSGSSVMKGSIDSV